MNQHPQNNVSELRDLQDRIRLLEEEKAAIQEKLTNAQSQLDKLNALSELSAESALFLDEKLTIIDCNKAAISLFECSKKEELLGQTIANFLSGDVIDKIQNKLKERLNGFSNFKIQSSLTKKNKQAAHINLSITYPSNNCIIILLQDTTEITQIQAESKKQIEILAKLSIFNYEIKQASTCSELKESLCNQCILLTEADETWVLSNISGDQIELVAYKDHLITVQNANLNKDWLTHSLSFLDTPQDVYILENTNQIKVPGIDYSENIEFQYVIGSRHRSGNWTLLGLNYKSKIKNVDDLEFLRNIFSQVFTTFENLANYEKLIENETRFRAIIEKSENVVCVLNKDLVYSYVSPSIQNYYYDAKDFLNKKPGVFTHPDDVHLYLEALNRVLNTTTSSISIPTIRNLRKDGSITYSHIGITDMRQVKGVEGLVINIKDINQRIQYESKLRQSEEKFRNIFNIGNDPIYIADLKGKFLEVNNMAVERTGVSKSDYLKLTLHNFSPEISKERVDEFIAEIIKTGSATTEESYKNKEGILVYFQITGKLIDYNNDKALLLRTINITDKKNSQRQILDTVIKTEESERARFARELHDGIGPYLSAIKFFLQTLMREEDPETRNSINKKALESIDEIIRNIKEISNNISPRVLNHFGIIPAINSLIKKVSDNQIDISIHSNIEGVRFNENVEINIFRICTELINNSLKHSKATKLELSLTKEGENLIVTYSDNGIGFNYKKKYAQGSGSGLFNIENRVNSLNGKYEFKSCLNNGLKVKAIFEIK